MAAKHLQLQSIIDNSPLVIYAKDADHRYLLANRELEVQLGLPAGGAVGRARRRAARRGRRPRERRVADQRVLDSGRAFEAEETLTVGEPRARLPAAPLPAARRPTAASTASAASAPTSPSGASARTRCGRSSSGPLRIRRAIDEDRLVLYAQPIVEIATGSPGPGGAARADERRGRAARSCRATFLPPAERFHLAPLIDRWVIAQAARLAATRPRGGQPLRPERGRRRRSWSTWRPSSADAGADPSNVVFEITETAAGAGHRPGHAARRAALGARLRLRARRLRHRLRQLHLPEAPAGRLPEDRHGVRAPPEARLARTCRWSARSSTWPASSASRRWPRAWRARRRSTCCGELGADFAQGYHLGFPAPVDVAGR